MGVAQHRIREGLGLGLGAKLCFALGKTGECPRLGYRLLKSSPTWGVSCEWGLHNAHGRTIAWGPAIQ